MFPLFFFFPFSFCKEEALRTTWREARRIGDVGAVAERRKLRAREEESACKEEDGDGLQAEHVEEEGEDATPRIDAHGDGAPGSARSSPLIES